MCKHTFEPLSLQQLACMHGMPCCVLNSGQASKRLHLVPISMQFHVEAVFPASFCPHVGEYVAAQIVKQISISGKSQLYQTMSLGILMQVALLDMLTLASIYFLCPVP